MEKGFQTVIKLVGVFLLALIVGGAFFHKNLQSTFADLLSQATLTEEEREVLKNPAAATKASQDSLFDREAYERSQAIQRQFNGIQGWKPPTIDTRFHPQPQPQNNWNRGWKK